MSSTKTISPPVTQPPVGNAQPSAQNTPKYSDVSGNYTKETPEDANKPSAERIEKFTLNLKIIVNRLVAKLESLKGAVSKDKAALDTLQEVIDQLNNISGDSGDSGASGASAEKYIDGVFTMLKTKKAVPPSKEFVTVFEPDFKEIFDKNGVKSAVEKTATSDTKAIMNKQATDLNKMITETISPAVHDKLKADNSLKNEKNIKNIKETQIIPDFSVNLNKIITATKPPAGGNPNKTAKKQLRNLISNIPGMATKTQKKHRKHRKH